MPTPQELLEALKQVKYPGFSRDIVAFGMVKDIEVGGTGVTVQLASSTDNAETIGQIRQGVIDTLTPLVRVPVAVIIQRAATATPRQAKPEMPGIQYVVAVASGKGGVGKSTVTVNLALALSAIGQRVGILDADVYGPSITLMLGLKESPRSTEDMRLIPVTKYDLKVMSMGFILQYCHASPISSKTTNGENLIS
jgi:ATP-binding protein involved in chromosome partitioning